MTPPTPTPSFTEALETLRQVNEYLASALLRLLPEQTRCAAIRPQDFAGLHTEIRRAGDSLRYLAAPPETTAALEPDALQLIALKKESLKYYRHLERLKVLLPDLQGRLLLEKARLETAKSRAAAITAWAGASRKTL